MLDIKFIRENPDVVRADLEKRGDTKKIEWLEELLELDKKGRELTVQSEKLRHQRNVSTSEVAELTKKNTRQSISKKVMVGKREGTLTLSSVKATPELEAKLKSAANVREQIKSMEADLEKIKDRIKFILMRLPNVMDPSVPVGKDDSENQPIEHWGTPRKFDFDAIAHGELAQKNGWADFDHGAIVSGAGFNYLTSDLVLLDFALMKFALDSMIKKGYTPVEPPFMISRKAYEGVTDLADFENVMYKIDGEELYLIATSEHPICAMFMNEVFEEKRLPLKLVGISPCFRREIGSHGVDTRGLFRMHQFNKVEQFIFCKPEDSKKLHEETINNAKEFFRQFELPFRVVNICTGDIGIVAAKKYDIEAWMPRENKYREVVSGSNCTSYQAVRLNIKYKTNRDGKDVRDYVHTINCTAIATSRAMRAILENHQNKDGTVTIPKVLRPYMHGKELMEIRKPL